MFIDRIINQGAAPTLERLLQFTEARHRLLAEDVANVSTPNYLQKDLSVDAFNKQLSEHVASGDLSSGAADGSGAIQTFDVNGATAYVSGGGMAEEIQSDEVEPHAGILFHDRNNRSMETLMTEQAKNALMHNVAVELLRQQYTTLDMAIKEKPE